MKKQFIPIFCSFLFILNLQIAAQNNVWTLPGKYLKFPTSTTTSLPVPPTTPSTAGYPEYYQGQQANFSHNAMQDAQGNLLFFIVDDMLYDKDGYLIDQLKFNGFPAKGSQEICIVPVPGSCTRYYIFTAFAQHPTGHHLVTRPGYAILNLALPNVHNQVFWTGNKMGALENRIVDSNGNIITNVVNMQPFKD
ncbi:MAG: hypothetical protein M3Q58_14875 [Bacteroidota bacterium]|nr:hypothetical protein [Bacteroidota bacterium]